MFVLLCIILLFLAILLIGVVLLQPGKGDMITGMGGLGGTFSNMLGSRRATDLLSKITIGLASAILLLSIVTNIFFVNKTSDIVKPVTEGTVVPKTIPSTPQQQIPVPAAAPTQNEKPNNENQQENK